MLQWLNANCAKVGNVPGWRIWDDDFQDSQLANVDPILSGAYHAVKAKATANQPWIGISNGKSGVIIQLPATVDETFALIGKFK